MSYLLTEIALEMLGYKFYDTNGVFHLTNFQQSAADAQNDIHPEEPSLMEFIDQPSKATHKSEKNGHKQMPTSSVPSATISVDLRRAPVRALAKIIEDESYKFRNGHEQQQQHQQQPQQQQQQPKQFSTPSSAPQAGPVVLMKTSNTPRRTPARALVKIMDYESFNVRSQISTRLETVLKASPTTNEENVKNLLNAEMQKLIEDAENIQKFRKFLEERLKYIDFRPFETYLRTFGSD